MTDGFDAKAGRLVALPENPVSLLSVVSEREVSSVPPGLPPTAPARTLLVFPDCKPGSIVRFHGGRTASGVTVHLLFWGDVWNGGASGRREEVVDKVKELLAGPYFSALDQYGVVAKPVYGSARVVSAPRPPVRLFDGQDVGTMVWELIHDGVFPAPGEPDSYNAYFAFLPEGAVLEEAIGAHGAKHWHAWMFWTKQVWAAWATWRANVDETVALFSHEIAELLTDPEGDAWYDPAFEHKDAEVADLCQLGSSAQSAFVGRAMVRPYWSTRDGACVVPTNPLTIRIDGLISIDAIEEIGSEEGLEYPSRWRELCALLPACCFKGPYWWKNERLDETATVRVTHEGFHSPKVAWRLSGQVVPKGNGIVTLRTDVTRQAKDGTTVATEDVQLSVETEGDFLSVTNLTVAGSFHVVAEVSADEGGIVTSGGTEVRGGRREARCVLPFIGQRFTWDPQLQKDMERCSRASDDLADRFRKERVPQPGPPQPGELRPGERAILGSLGAGVSEVVRDAAKLAMLRAAELEKSHPKEADQLREALLSKLGVPSR